MTAEAWKLEKSESYAYWTVHHLDTVCDFVWWKWQQQVVFLVGYVSSDEVPSGT